MHLEQRQAHCRVWEVRRYYCLALPGPAPPTMLWALGARRPLGRSPLHGNGAQLGTRAPFTVPVVGRGLLFFVDSMRFEFESFLPQSLMNL